MQPTDEQLAAQEIRIIAGEVQAPSDFIRYHNAACVVKDRLARAKAEYDRAKQLKAEWDKFVHATRDYAIEVIKTSGEYTTSGNPIVRTSMGSTYVQTKKEPSVRIDDLKRVLDGLGLDPSALEKVGSLRSETTYRLTDEGRRDLKDFILRHMEGTGEQVGGCEITLAGTETLQTKVNKIERMTRVNAGGLLPRGYRDPDQDHPQLEKTDDDE